MKRPAALYRRIRGRRRFACIALAIEICINKNRPVRQAAFARIGHAVSAPKRIELLDLLAQGEKTVEQLAEQSATPVKNTSAHLRVLRQALNA